MNNAEARAAADGLCPQFAGLADPDRAAHEKAYQKSDDTFYGAGVPAIRKVVGEFLKAHKGLTVESLWVLSDELWSRGIWELKVFTAFALTKMAKQLEPGDLEKVKKLVVAASGWAINDQVGCHVLSVVVETHPETLEEMDHWAKDGDIWVRRVAMQSLLLSLRTGDLKHWRRFVGYAEPLLEEKDFWTRKVIGWICREVSYKHPAVVFEFLEKNLSRCSGLTLREGAKRLSPEDRQRLGLV